MIYDSSDYTNPAIDEIRNAFRYKDFIAHLIRKDITTKYKRSILGIVWTMLNPLGMMIIMTVVFQNFFKRQEFYSVYLLTGLLTFTFFNQTSSAIIHNLVWGQELFHRIYIPRASFAIAAVGTSIVNLVLALVPLLLVKLVIQSPISWEIVLFPLYILFLACFSMGVGLIVASLAIHFHDIAQIYQVILTAWFYATPIIYPYDTLAENVKKFVFLNPMMHIVELMRASFYYNTPPAMNDLLITGGVSFAALIFGWLLFSKQAEEFVMR